MFAAIASAVVRLTAALHFVHGSAGLVGPLPVIGAVGGTVVHLLAAEVETGLAGVAKGPLAHAIVELEDGAYRVSQNWRRAGLQPQPVSFAEHRISGDAVSERLGNLARRLVLVVPHPR